MNSALQLFRETGMGAYLQLAGALLGPLWALVCAVLLGLRWKVPPLVATLPLALHELSAILAISLANSNMTRAVVHADPEQRAVIMAAGTSELLGNGVLLALALPSVMLLALGGMVGGLRGSRSFGAPVMAFLLAGLVSLYPLVEFFYEGDPVTILGRVLFYGMGAIVLTVSMLGDDPFKGAREASMTTALAFFCGVAITETALASAEWASVLGALAGVEPSVRSTLIDILKETDTRLSLRWVSLLLAALPVVVAWLRASAPLTEEQLLNERDPNTPMRGASHFLALGLIPLWLAVVWTADPSGTITQIMAEMKRHPSAE